MRSPFNVSLPVLRSEYAGRYCSKALRSYLCKHEILRQSSCVNTPSQNRVYERKNRQFLETARALSFHMHVPKQFWVDAISWLASWLITSSFVFLGWHSLSYSISNKTLVPYFVKNIWLYLFCSRCTPSSYKIRLQVSVAFDYTILMFRKDIGFIVLVRGLPLNNY